MNLNDFPWSWTMGGKTGPTFSGMTQKPKNANCEGGMKCGSCTLCTCKIDLQGTQYMAGIDNGHQGGRREQQPTHKC